MNSNLERIIQNHNSSYAVKLGIESLKQYAKEFGEAQGEYYDY